MMIMAKDNASKKGINPWDIIMYPHLAEKSMNMIEMENKLVLIVRRKSRKSEIKEAIEKEFGVKVESIRTLVTTDGKKKAIATLAPDYQASDIASKFGMM